MMNHAAHDFMQAAISLMKAYWFHTYLSSFGPENGAFERL